MGPTFTVVGRPTPRDLKRYPFFPQAGQLWKDLFPNNFVDLDSREGSENIRDYHSTAYTYDRHNGIDTEIDTFEEKRIGVPIFAVLSGTVTAASDAGASSSNPDENAPWTGVISGSANYVTIDHSPEHRTDYYHLANGSVRVSVGQKVMAGQQIGNTGSSGSSDWPHLHFVSTCTTHGEGFSTTTFYEPFSGPSNPGRSGWVRQVSFSPRLYIRVFKHTLQDISAGPWNGPPEPTTNTGTVSPGMNNLKFWALLANLPENSEYRFKFIRPNGTVAKDTGYKPVDGNNPESQHFYRRSYWKFVENVYLDTPGEWRIDVYFNRHLHLRAPLLVAHPYNNPGNRPPYNIRWFEFGCFYGQPFNRDDAVFVIKVSTNLVVGDPDYDVVRYHYEWIRQSKQVLRDVIHAGTTDVLPAGKLFAGETLTCRVTPYDGQLFGETVTKSIRIPSWFGSAAP